MTSQNSSAFDELLKRVTPQSTLTFALGLPGFPDETRFVLLQNPEERPFAWLQSLKTASLSFVVTSPFVLFPEYRPDVPDFDLTALDSPPQEDTLILCIIKVVQTTPTELHTNLKAPLVINLRTLTGRQVILNNEAMYSEIAIYRVKSML
ncbi:MAG: flagellar assembly protein FliW [Verrucomicrobiae bacterium]|nr:flagellar assembly protein FliW [Verrucomicrobiae bacterium]